MTEIFCGMIETISLNSSKYFLVSWLVMSSRILTIVLWVIFTAYFFYMSWKERSASTAKLESLEQFNVRQQGGTRFDAGFSPGEAFYALREELNNSDRESHRIAAKSYFAAGLTALVSSLLSLADAITFLMGQN